MSDRKIKTYRTIFYLLLSFSLIFIVTSFVLIYNVQHVKHEVETNVITISELSQINRIASEFDFEKNDLSAFQSELSSIEINTETATNYFDQLINISNQSVSQKEFSLQKNKVSAQIRREIGQIRGELSKLSVSLNNYWWFSHGLIMVACILAITATLMGYKTFQAKSQLQSSEESKDEFFNLTADAVISTDEEGKIKDINEAALLMFGYSFSEIKKKGLHILYDNSDDFFTVLKSIEQEGFFKGEIINKKKDGTRFISYLSANVIRDQNGNMVGSMGISRDITDVKNKEEQYKKLIKNTELLIQTIDLNGKLIFANESWEKVLQYDFKTGFSLKAIVHPEHHKKFEAVFNSLCQGHNVEDKNIILDLVDDHGQRKSFEWNFSIEKDLDDQVIAIQAFLKNITEKAKILNQLEKSESNFRQITETLNDVFYLYNVLEQEYEYISPNCEEILGVDQDTVMKNLPNKTSVYPKDLEIVKNAKTIVESGQSYEIEYRLIIDDEIKWINEKSFPIKDNLDNVIKNPGVCRDITKYKETLDLVQNKNKEIENSIDYARKIQLATLPNAQEISKYFSHLFAYHHSKDQLSGDFYIVNAVRTNEGEELPVVVVADCTGHGIPGGILSLLCQALLRETFTNSKINSPAEALDYTRERVTTLLNENYTESAHIYDGMDVAFCVFNKSMTKLTFSSANIPCYVVKNDQRIVEYKAQRQHIGFNSKPQPFENVEIQLEKGDMIYISTDGYVDQFGGPKDKKFMRSQFKSLLQTVHEHPIQEQKEMFRSKLIAWKGENTQTDDITVVGIRV